ncbi:Response regulator receiver protein [Candidatus Desulfosporosinus infrequens]|uniref:Stage 0 sporulation protein A homolog n=1 Tax=Candidatus Desulfosporosinus infrequens TaxID=2043169 RepID=A0A2U3LSD2_9FIRM|nr:Response regulator receiver protein [Candidatus Desulfosporosinus infrequens]
MAKILIADDEKYIRLLLEQTLEEITDEGVQLFFAVDGKEALDIIQKEQPELVFLDLMMPKLTGLEVCDLVKNKLGLEKIYIIMLTAKCQVGDMQRGLGIGADNYISKPFDLDGIIEITKQVLAM